MTKPVRYTESDLEVIQHARGSGAVFITDDARLRELMPGSKPSAFAKTLPGSTDAATEVANETGLRSLSPAQVMALAEAAGKRWQKLSEDIPPLLDESRARFVRALRVEQRSTWRAVALACWNAWGPVENGLPWSPPDNQLAGMMLCRKSAERLGEDDEAPPWN